MDTELVLGLVVAVPDVSVGRGMGTVWDIRLGEILFWLVKVVFTVKDRWVGCPLVDPRFDVCKKVLSDRQWLSPVISICRNK